MNIPNFNPVTSDSAWSLLAMIRDGHGDITKVRLKTGGWEYRAQCFPPAWSKKAAREMLIFALMWFPLTILGLFWFGAEYALGIVIIMTIGVLGFSFCRVTLPWWRNRIEVPVATDWADKLYKDVRSPAGLSVPLSLCVSKWVLAKDQGRELDAAGAERELRELLGMTE